MWKAQIAGQYTGVHFEVPAFQIGVDNKTPEFAAKFPLQKVPALETPEGPLFESNAIARYGITALPSSLRPSPSASLTLLFRAAARYGGNSTLYGSSAYEAVRSPPSSSSVLFDMVGWGRF